MQEAERILLEHPELYDMSLDDVLIKLDDGTDATQSMGSDSMDGCKIIKKF